MITLGLDPSMTGFGWAVHDSSKEGPERVVSKGIFVTSASEVFVKRYIDLRGHVLDVLDKYPSITGVAVESPPFGELWSEGLYGLFVVVNEALYQHRKDVVYFDPGSLKMLAKGDPLARRGKMFKADMVQVARTDTGLKTGRFNHNEADAYLLAKFAARFWSLFHGELFEQDLTPAEHQAFVNEHTFQKGPRKGLTVKTGALFKEGQRYYRFSTLPKNPTESQNL